LEISSLKLKGNFDFLRTFHIENSMW